MKPKCSICNGSIRQKNIQLIGSLFPFNGAMDVNNWGFIATFLGVVKAYPDFYQWACDDCINSEKAILADPKKQNYSVGGRPYLAYYDLQRTCRSCGDDFLFSKEEQRFWYEELEFYVDSKPIHCKPCNKKIKASKNLNTELSDLLKEGKPSSKEQLLRIADIYQEMGKEAKMKSYLTAIKKIRSDDVDNTQT